MFDQDSDDASRLPLAESGVDRDVQIEQHLLAGLDHYFNAQYEQVLDVWTRVLFLDRGDARVRAYIERVRAAFRERSGRPTSWCTPAWRRSIGATWVRHGSA